MQTIAKSEAEITPEQSELPSCFAERLGLYYAMRSTSTDKKMKGQYFTPLAMARYMAAMATCRDKSISILDPGCGAGILSIALSEFIAGANPQLRSIKIVAYDTDVDLIKYSGVAFEFLKKWLLGRGIQLEYIVHAEDFVLANSNALNAFTTTENTCRDKFDYIIANPPYFKLSRNDQRTKAARGVVNGHANIYSIFVSIASQLLNPRGECITITPRSFCSGNYFQTFRTSFFQKVKIEQAHLFHSRKETFSRDKVLQETLIMKCTPKEVISDASMILVKSSSGTRDLDESDKLLLPSSLVVDYSSKDKIVFLPTNLKERKIVELFREWSGNLNRYNIQISTGPVVAHRATKFIVDKPSETATTVPLLWLHNVSKMSLAWPVERSNKGQYILADEDSRSILVDNKNYLLLRRFSSKDDKSRLIAAPYYSNTTTEHSIGIENKLNYIYRPKGNLEQAEILGLGALLNSDLFDAFFRIINGNVNVSATELRFMPLPPHEQIVAIGNRLIHRKTYDSKVINNLIAECLKMSTIY